MTLFLVLFLANSILYYLYLLPIEGFLFFAAILVLAFVYDIYKTPKEEKLVKPLNALAEKNKIKFRGKDRMFKFFMTLLFLLLLFAYFLGFLPDSFFLVAVMILGSIVLIRKYLKRNKKIISTEFEELDVEYEIIPTDTENLIKWADENNISHHALPRSAEVLQNVTSLNLSNQGITQLPKEIGSLYNLEELNLDYNFLFELPDEIRALVNLHTLRLSNNKFKSRPKILATLPNITTLTLQNNQIFRQSPEIEALNYLAGEVAHRRAGVRPEDEYNLLNREDISRSDSSEKKNIDALLNQPTYMRQSRLS